MRAVKIIVMLASLAAVLPGCSANTRLVSQWSNPAYTAPPFRRVMVAGSGGESAVRRNFEDEFVAQLKAAGIDALPSYRALPEDYLDEAKVRKAAKEAGADAVILARSTGAEHRTEYRPSYYPYPAFGVFGPHVGATWYGFYGAPIVRSYDVHTSEATLYDVGKNEVVWTGTVRTTDPDEISAVIKNYVQTVLKALREKDLLRARP